MDDRNLEVASLDDLMATKLKVLLQRVESKDYLDIAAILGSGISLAKGLAAAREMYGSSFQPSESLKALTFQRRGSGNGARRHSDHAHRGGQCGWRPSDGRASLEALDRPGPMKARTIELPKPTVQAIRMARARAGLTQAAAAQRVHAASYRTWQDWESGRRVMPLAAWELFLAKIGERKIADR